jgi:predicted aspartyl protease
MARLPALALTIKIQVNALNAQVGNLSALIEKLLGMNFPNETFQIL